MAKLRCYNIADKGVNVTKSPIHLEDGELTKAQNWQTDPTLADGAIRRRDAMTKLNASAMAGSVKGLAAINFTDAFTQTRTFYAPIDDATTNTWRISTTGAAASWSTITTATLRKAQTAAHSSGVGGVFGSAMLALEVWAALNHKIYFPGDDYNSPEEAGTPDTPPTLYQWDGTTATQLATVPSDPNSLPSTAVAITAIVPYSATELLIGVNSINVTTNIRYASLLLYDLITGTMEQLGPATSIPRGVIWAPYMNQGRIWIGPMYLGAAGAATLDIMWLRPGDSAWTGDAQFHANSIGGTSMAEFRGDLYMGTISSAGAVATIRKRNAATTAWSTVKSTDGAGLNQYCGPLIVTADKLTLLAYYYSNNGAAPTARILSSTDGTTWITDLDLSTVAVGLSQAGVPYLDTDGSVYWAIRKSDNTGFILKRTSGGVWSTVDTINNLKGPILPLKVIA